MVDPRMQRRGVGRALMRRAEQTARGIGRSLLTLDTRADSAAAALYRAMGWTELGRIPGYELDGDRALSDAVFFWKRAGGEGA
jgi:ribosomal protein S18 acetylase RimI-like enzyme